MDGIPPALLTGGGLTGVLTLLIVAFIKGWLVVGSVHRDILRRNNLAVKIHKALGGY